MPAHPFREIVNCTCRPCYETRKEVLFHHTHPNWVMVNGDIEEKMNKWASVWRALSVYQDLTPASKVWRRQAMAKRWSIFSWKCRIRDPPGRRTQDLCYHWKWSKGFRWEWGLSIPSAARGEMGHSRAVKRWKAESTGKSWTTSMKRQETAGATLQRTHKTHHEKNQQPASSVHASHNQCISSQFPASQRPSAPFNTGSGMNKEISLSISPLRMMLNFLNTGCWVDTAEGGCCPAVPTTGRGGRHRCQVSWSSTGMGHGPWGQSLCNLVRLAGDQLSAAFRTCRPESHSAHTLSRPRFARELPLQALTPTAVSCHPACTPERCLLLASNSQPRSKLDRQETCFLPFNGLKHFFSCRKVQSLPCSSFLGYSP